MEPTPRLETTRRDAFIVRIWQKDSQPGWLGWVQHVGSGESAAVQHAEDLVAFIEKRVGQFGQGCHKGLK